VQNRMERVHCSRSVRGIFRLLEALRVKVFTPCWAACFTSWFRTMRLDVAMFSATFAHFVAGSIVLHLRFFSARIHYSFRWTFARRMASYSACSAHSIWARAYFLAMPRLRAQRTVILARCATGSVRFRSAVGANHRVCDPMMIRFRFL
jgi:hypothetical protein